MHGVARAIKHFKSSGIEIKKSSARNWRIARESCSGETVAVQLLSGKKRGRPPLIGTLLDKKLQGRIVSMRSLQAVIMSHC